MWGVGCARLRRAGEGASARERAERAEAGDSGAERGEGKGGRERSGEGRGQQRETGSLSSASPMVLHCVVGEEVAATFKSLVSYDMGSFFCVWLRY